MKKLLFVIFAFMLFFASVSPVLATSEKIVDKANILSTTEESTLLALAAGAAEKHKCDVAIVTVSSISEKSAKEYADDFFNEHGYGYGEDHDGILFLIVSGSREWAISTHGFGSFAFTDAGQAYILDKIVPQLVQNEYNKALSNFAVLCDKFLAQARTGTPYDEGHFPAKSLRAPLPKAFIGIAIGFIISFTVVSLMRRSLQNFRAQVDEDDYIQKDSIEIHKSREMFLYKTYSRIERQGAPSRGKPKGKRIKK